MEDYQSSPELFRSLIKWKQNFTEIKEYYTGYSDVGKMPWLDQSLLYVDSFPWLILGFGYNAPCFIIMCFGILIVLAVFYFLEFVSSIPLIVSAMMLLAGFWIIHILNRSVAPIRDARKQIIAFAKTLERLDEPVLTTEKILRNKIEIIDQDRDQIPFEVAMKLFRHVDSFSHDKLRYPKNPLPLL